MEGEVVLKAAGLLTFGSMFIWLGIDGWRHRGTKRPNLWGATGLKAAGETAPEPPDRFDRVMSYIQPILMLLFGPAMIFLGLRFLGLFSGVNA